MRFLSQNNMSRPLIIGFLAVTIYIVWLIVFLLVVEPWLRRLTEFLLGVTIVRQLERPVGKIELLDALFMFGWKVETPASLGLRFIVGCLRFTFWMMAVIIPICLALALYFWMNRSPS